MEFRLLGPVEVRHGGRSLRLGGQKPRTLLAVLLLDAGRVVGTGRLADAIWEREPPATASTQIQGYVSSLRKQFADVEPDRAVIATAPSGYRIDLRPGELDLELFDEMAAAAAKALAEARPEDASAGYRDALGLWEGTALSGVAGTLGSSRDRLEERRLAAFEHRVEADLRLGRHDELVAELRDVVAGHPFREAPRGQLMLALYRAGRTADALAVYRDARETLAAELGLDPGPDLRRMEQAILRSDPSLELPSSVPDAAGLPPPAQLPPDILDFTGRVEQVEQVCAALSRDDGPSTAVAVTVIAGRGGVGKSSLAVHAAHRMRPGFPDGQLHVNLHGAQARRADPSEILARFLRALGVAPERVPDSAEERGELFRSRLAGRRVLVVLDNAADEAQVRPLLPGEPGCAVLVTSRARLVGLEGARLVDLEILDADAAFALLGSVAGPERVADDRRAGEEIVRLCGYLPLAVRIAGAKLADNPYWSPTHLADRLADERHRLDELAIGDLEVRANVALSYAGLDDEEKQAFRRLGLLEAPEFATWVLAALAGVGQERAGELADALVRARLLDGARGTDGGPVRYRLHDLLRLYARELAGHDEEPEQADAALRRALDGWCHGADEAYARTRSAAFGVVLVPADGWRAEPGAFGDPTRSPLEWYEAEWPALLAAIEQAHDQGWNGLVIALGGRMGPFFVVRGRYDDWRRVSELSLSAAEQEGLPHREGAAHRSLAELARLQTRLDEARSRFVRSIDRCRAADDRFGAALAESGLGAVETDLGDLGPAREHLEEAVAELREVGDPRTTMWAVLRLGVLHGTAGRFDEAADHFHRALELTGDSGSPVDEAAVAERLGDMRVRQGRPEEAPALYERALALRRAHRDRFGEANALRGLGAAQRALGNPAVALDLLAAASRRWRELDFPVEQARTFALLGDVHDDLGDPESARSAREEAARLDPARRGDSDNGADS